MRSVNKVKTMSRWRKEEQIWEVVIDSGDGNVSKEQIKMGVCSYQHDIIFWRLDGNKYCPACSQLSDTIYDHDKKLAELYEQIDSMEIKMAEPHHCDKCQALIDLKK